MAFSILTKRTLEENDNIKRIVDNITEYETIFTYEQQRKLNIAFSSYTELALQDYDTISNNGSIYRIIAQKI